MNDHEQDHEHEPQSEESYGEDIELQLRILELDAELRHVRAQLASSRAMTEMLQSSLLEAGSNEFRERDDDLAPLLMAARGGDIAMIDLLLSTAPEAERNTALLVASQHGQAEAAARLLQAGANVHTDHDSALLWACKAGNQQLARVLMSHGADPGALNGCAMRIAVRMGDTSIARILLGDPGDPGDPGGPGDPEEPKPKAKGRQRKPKK